MRGILLKTADEIRLEQLKEYEDNKKKFYLMEFWVPDPKEGGRWHQVEASGIMLHDLCKGPQARNSKTGLAHGELKGVRVRFPNGTPPLLQNKGQAA